LNSGRDSVDLIAGGAYAKGLEVARILYYTEGESADYAQAVGEDALIEEYGDFTPYEGDRHKKCLSGVINIYREYFNNYPFEFDTFEPVELEDGKRAIEYPFAIELPYLHPELGIPLHFVGRFDMLVEFRGQLYGLDDKTKSGYLTQQQKSADETYQALRAAGRGKGTEEPSWATRGQFTAYAWAMQKLGFELDGFLVREAWFHSQSTYTHRQVFTQRRQSQIDAWEKQLYRQVEQMITKYNQVLDGEPTSDAYDMANESSICVSYGRACPFTEFCSGEIGEQYLEDRFEQSVWIPEEARRVSLEDYIESIVGGLS
jgi:hypothetical protein